jgi:segregation and condensation protein A
MERILDQLGQQGQIAFSNLFVPGMHKSSLIGIFLAVLELVRHYRVRVAQNDVFGEIWLFSQGDAAGPLDPAVIDNYDHASK